MNKLLLLIFDIATLLVTSLLILSGTSIVSNMDWLKLMALYATMYSVFTTRTLEDFDFTNVRVVPP